jgi:sulfate adenylyltransferase subunit 1
MGINREILKIVVVGHVDHGKSTVIGRLLYDTNSIPTGKIDRVKDICKEKGKPFEYAYLLDAFEEEQKQGITIDTTQLQFFTKKRDYVIIDAPGHKEFLKNMISGAANAEAALLIIDGLEGVQEQSKRHGYILSLLGIQKVYVIVNKMDLIDYSEDKFNAIKQEMNEFLHSLNVYPLQYIPISAFFGENMTSKSDKMEWYEGKPILLAIDLIEKDEGLEDKPLRFPIQDVYKFDSRRIIAGRIESGTLKLGDEILITPSNKVTKVKTIEYWQDKDNSDTVSAGMSVGITVEDEFFNKRGEFISHKESPPLTANIFKANLFWMGKKTLEKGKKYKLKLATGEVESEIIYINKVIDASTLETLENANGIKTNDVAVVTIKTKEKISFDEFKHNQNTGRFVLVEDYNVSGGGIITGIEKGVQIDCKLVDENNEFSVNCFDEYYYILTNNTVRNFPCTPNEFSVNDAIPVSGDTYTYPENFDILDIKTKLMAKIRNALLQDIVTFDEYNYENVRIITSRGLLVKINSQDDLINYKNELFDNLYNPLFANLWYDFVYFKHIKFIDEIKNIDFQI